MKTIRIFALPSHATKERTSGVDFARIIQPMKALDGYVLGDIKFKVHVYDVVKDKTLDWMEVAKEYDIMYLNYTAVPMQFAMMGLMMRKHGRPIVLDLDDSLWDIVEDNPAYKIYKKGSEAIRNFTSIANEVDYITTTNGYLRNVIDHHTNKKDITVFPNYIDFDLYNHRAKFKDTPDIRLLHFGCFDDKTEILTENGFKFFKDLDKNEKVATLNKNGFLEYQKPINYMEYDFDGELMCVDNQQVSYAVTPNHQLYTGKRNNEDWKIRIAEDVYKTRFRVKKDALWEGKEKDVFKVGGKTIPMDDWLKFFGFWLAEGWTTKNKFKQKSGNLTDCMQVGVVHKKDDKILHDLEKILLKAGFNPKLDDRGQLRVFNKQLWEYLRKFGGAGEKYVPKEIKALSPRQIKILMDWYIYGDGHIEENGRVRATTISKRLVDDLTEMAIKIGWSANYYERKPKDVTIEGRFIPVSRHQPCYTVAFIRKVRIRPHVLPKNQFEREYVGKVYDVEVPNHTLYVRRNGKCMWSGNSTTHFKDLQTEEFGKGIDKIMKRYPNVKLKTVGAMIPAYKKRWGQRYEDGFGDVDVYKWIKDKFPAFMDEADICVIPLDINPYTICKSDIKRSEMSSAGKPIVAQKIRQYKASITNGVDGYLVKTADDWFNAISKLIEDKKHRKEVGQKGFEKVRDEKQMKDHIEEYAEFFKRISEDYKPQEEYLV